MPTGIGVRQKRLPEVRHYSCDYSGRGAADLLQRGAQLQSVSGVATVFG